jgi:prenyltransferase beta subunit
MRSLLALLLLPAFALAQTADEKKATVKFIDSLRDPDTGAWAVSPPKDGEKPKPSLRAVNGAVNALKYFGGEVTDKEKVTKFVLGCYDEKTGAFAEPGEKPTVAMTCVGVLAATALGIDKAKYKKAMEYLKANAKTFEDYRLAAAAIEAFGVKESGIDVDDWVGKTVAAAFAAVPISDWTPRVRASLAAARLRLGNELHAIERETDLKPILDGQLKDGGWGNAGAKTSDAETTYRVMRALMLLKEKPKDVDGVTKFVASCRRKDGGYGVDAEAPSSMSGVYYAAKISEWLK